MFSCTDFIFFCFRLLALFWCTEVGIIEMDVASWATISKKVDTLAYVAFRKCGNSEYYDSEFPRPHIQVIGMDKWTWRRRLHFSGYMRPQMTPIMINTKMLGNSTQGRKSERSSWHVVLWIPWDFPDAAGFYVVFRPSLDWSTHPALQSIMRESGGSRNTSSDTSFMKSVRKSLKHDRFSVTVTTTLSFGPCRYNCR